MRGNTKRYKARKFDVIDNLGKVLTGRKLRERLRNFTQTKLLLRGWPILRKWRKRPLAKIANFRFALLRVQGKRTFSLNLIFTYG